MAVYTSRYIVYECSECGDMEDSEDYAELKKWIGLKSGEIYCPDCYYDLT